MKKILDKVKRISNILMNTPYMYVYPHYYRKLKIIKNVVLIEASHGNNIAGHLFYMVKELTNHRKELKIYLTAQDVTGMTTFLTEQNIQGVQVVQFLSKEYCHLLASAEYLLNDTTFYPFFNKKAGQTYINIWHGTPLKTLGKDVEIITDVANVQRNFYMADKIITNNETTQKILANSHNLNGVYQGKMVIAPSPRNAILLNKEKGAEIRQKLNLANKKVIFYMPTWRGSVGKVENTDEKVLTDLRYISKRLSVDEKFFVKLHPMQQNIDLSGFSNIFTMPKGVELYEFLTGVDTLITDYSSIMYDFLLRDKKIILYVYDKEEYFRTRGVYENIDDYPFPQCATVEELVQEIKREHTDVTYNEMKERFCSSDCADGVSILCDYLFSDQQYEGIKETTLYNGKETAVVLSGGFWDNGVTTALLNTLENIDTAERNYICFFDRSQLKPQHYFRVRNLPKGVSFYPSASTMNGSFLDRICYSLHIRTESFRFPFIQNRVGRMMREEFRRQFGDLKIQHFIHYTGFERKYAEMLKHLPQEMNRVMFVHTDMFQEYEAKKNYNRKVIFSAYEGSSKVALVNKNLAEKLVNHLPSIKNKVYVMDNFLGEERIRDLAQENLFVTLIPTAVDYACGEVEEGNPNILLSKKAEFFKWSPIYADYASIDVEQELGQVTVSEVAQKLIEKVALADYLLMTRELGEVKSRMLNDLFNEDITFFINIGRYDYQKGHERLIAAFEKVYLKNSNTRLIIVAPHGPLRKETIKWAEESKARNGIFILGRMSNPYPLLKACDAFVLSSHYEGLGLVLYEALALETTGITVNLAATTEYLTDEAIIVDNSEEGLYEGMSQFLVSGGKGSKFDFSIPKERSRGQFRELMKV